MTTARPCRACGRPFEPPRKRGGRRTYCSAACGYAGQLAGMRRRRAARTPPKVCEWCGAEYRSAARGPCAKTCSPACEAERNVDRARRRNAAARDDPDARERRREASNDRHRERYASDPEYRAEHLRRGRVHRQRHRDRERERLLLVGLDRLSQLAGGGQPVERGPPP